MDTSNNVMDTSNAIDVSLSTQRNDRIDDVSLVTTHSRGVQNFRHFLVAAIDDILWYDMA